MVGDEQDGPFLGALSIRGRILVGTQKGTILLTTTYHMQFLLYLLSGDPQP